MATVNLGRIKPVFRGAYNNSTAYVVDDIVTQSDETFICIQASTGNATSNASYWTKLAAKGTDGTDVGATITTQGDILYRDGSGLQRLGAGTSGQFLKTQGTGANPVWANLASNVDIVNYTTFDGTGANTMSVTTDWATNNYWKMEIFGQYGVVQTGVSVRMRLRNSSGDISSDTYSHIGWYSHAQENHSGTGFAIHHDLNGGLNNINLNGWGFNSARMHPNFRVQLYKPDSNGRQALHRSYYNNDSSSPPYHAHYDDNYFCTDTSAKTGYTIYATSSGSGVNMINGFFVTIGYKYQ